MAGQHRLRRRSRPSTSRSSRPTPSASCCSRRGRPRPPRRPRAHPRRGEGRQADGAHRVDVRDRRRGERRGRLTLDDAIFGIQPNVPVMHQVVTAQLAAARRGTQSTKTRAEVSGGGAKPFSQKGTGRARQGSTRAPHWPAAASRSAQAPQLQAAHPEEDDAAGAALGAVGPGRRAAVGVVDRWPWDEPKTKEARPRSTALGLEGKVLVVLGPRREDALQVLPQPRRRAVLLPGELNAYDVLCNDWVVFTRDTLPGRAPSRPNPRLASPRPAGRRGPAAATVEARRPQRRTTWRRRRAEVAWTAPTRRMSRRAGTAESRRPRRPVMSDPRDVIIRPVVSEKSYGLLDQGVYIFVVAPERQQDRDPPGRRGDLRRHASSSVNTLNRKGKRKRNRTQPTFGNRADTKRAIVTPRRRRPHRPVRELGADDGRSASASRPAPVAGSSRSPTSPRSPRTGPSRRSSRPKPSTGGRNAYGRKTARHRGGGHKQQYRHHRLQAQQGRRARQGRGDRVRPEPQRPHRPAALPRRREALHPRPGQGRGRRRAAVRPGLRDPPRQRAADALHPGRFGRAQRRAAARAAAARWPAARA